MKRELDRTPVNNRLKKGETIVTMLAMITGMLLVAKGLTSDIPDMVRHDVPNSRQLYIGFGCALFYGSYLFASTIKKERK
jgi:hypothetical protein|tara:strand:+ start:142 stop:381 length:240 start_codon:yes stop_codon:yes gene_type:complete